jgi:methyl-accepting chemotaxis protein
LVSVILGWLVAHFITYPLGKMLTLTESLASGDLSQNTDASGPLEIYKMATGLNSAVSGLQQIVVVINERADNLFSASKELKTVLQKPVSPLFKSRWRWKTWQKHL